MGVGDEDQVENITNIHILDQDKYRPTRLFTYEEPGVVFQQLVDAIEENDYTPLEDLENGVIEYTIETPLFEDKVAKCAMRLQVFSVDRE